MTLEQEITAYLLSQKIIERNQAEVREEIATNYGLTRYADSMKSVPLYEALGLPIGDLTLYDLIKCQDIGLIRWELKKIGKRVNHPTASFCLRANPPTGGVGHLTTA
ncbi:MAG TPA: hypothetical protein VJK51_01355 [Candidatus Nanoarchaeia archaeon]|nr:hypothetical protein [Candidatus Nanoarchaeia archaeon]